jgi:hypothetical protein
MFTHQSRGQPGDGFAGSAKGEDAGGQREKELREASGGELVKATVFRQFLKKDTE